MVAMRITVSMNKTKLDELITRQDLMDCFDYVSSNLNSP